MSTNFFTIRDKSGAIVGLSTDPPADAISIESEPVPDLEPEPAASRLRSIRPGERPSLTATLGTAAATPTSATADQAKALAWWRQPAALAILAILAILALLAVLRPAMAPTVAPAADTIPQASVVVTAPIPTTAATLAHAVIAYAAPGGAVIGPLDGGRVITPTARCCGNGWVQLDAGGLDTPNLVWVEAGQLPEVELGQLVDLTPPTPVPTPVPTSPPPPAPAPVSAPQQPVMVPQPLIPAPQPIERCEENLYGRVCSTNPALITQGLAEIQATGVAEDAARAAARTAGQP